MQEENSTPAVVQSSVKIEPPKSFGGTSKEDMGSWTFSIELCFHAENRILPAQCGLHAVLNLSANAAIWFRVQTADLNLLSWDLLKVSL